MADAQRTIDLIFNGVDKTGAAVQSVIGNTADLAGNIQSATQPFADFTFAALKFEAALIASATALTAFAVKTAGDFDTAFREIATLVDQPINALEGFRQGILDYASTSTAPLDQVTSAIYNAISAGVDFEQAIEAVAQAEKLSVAGKADLNASLVVLVSSLNAYGLELDQAERFSDALFQTVKLGQTTLPELAAGLAQVTGTAATLEVPFETVLAAIAALTAQGTPTQQAITQINAAFTALIKPSKQASDLAAELGIQFDAQAIKAKGLEGVLNEVAIATGGNEEQMGTLFGSVEALRAVFPLTGKAAESFSDALDVMSTSAGATDAAFEKMANDVGQSIQKVQNSITGLLIAVGDPLLNEFGGVANSIAAIFQALGGSLQSNDGLGPLLQYVEQIAQEIEAAFATIAGNLPEALEGVDTTKAIEGLESLREAVEGLFDGVDLSTPEGIRDALQQAVDAFGNLSEFSAGAIEGLQPLVDIAANLFENFSNLDSATARANGEAFGFATTVNILSGFIANLLPSMETLVSIFFAGKIAGGLIGAFSGGAGASSVLSTSLGRLGLLGAVVALGFELDNLLAKINQFTGGDKLTTWLIDARTKFIELGEKAAEVAGFSDVPLLLAPPAAVAGLWVTAYNAIKDKIIETGDAAVDAQGALAFSEAAIQVPQITGGLIDAYGDVVDSLLGINDAASPEFLDNYVEALSGVSSESIETEAAARLVKGAFADQNKAVNGIIPILDEATGKIIGYTDGVSGANDIMTQSFQAAKKASDGINQLGLSAEEMGGFTEKAFVQLQELATNERIKNIEARVSLNIAELEADTERTLAAFDSITTSITSTGDLLGSLFGQLGGDFTFREGLAIEKQIEDENRRRDEALKKQSELTDAQIEAIRARTEAVERGDAMITVDGAGLQPHLEAFMWEILEAIQVRVNQEGLETLFP